MIPPRTEVWSRADHETRTELLRLKKLPNEKKDVKILVKNVNEGMLTKFKLKPDGVGGRGGHRRAIAAAVPDLPPPHHETPPLSLRVSRPAQLHCPAERLDCTRAMLRGYPSGRARRAAGETQVRGGAGAAGATEAGDKVHWRPSSPGWGQRGRAPIAPRGGHGLCLPVFLFRARFFVWSVGRDSHRAAMWPRAPAWMLTTWSIPREKFSVNVSAQCNRSPRRMPHVEGRGRPQAVLAWGSPRIQGFVNDRLCRVGTHQGLGEAERSGSEEGHRGPGGARNASWRWPLASNSDAMTRRVRTLGFDH